MAPNRDGGDQPAVRRQHPTALRARVQELEAREADRARSERVQAALYRIAEAAAAASDLQAFYAEVQETVAS